MFLGRQEVMALYHSVFGKGIGSKEKIGEIGNKDIFMFSNYKELSFNKESILAKVSKIVKKKLEKRFTTRHCHIRQLSTRGTVLARS